jgi:hypothetical protein
MVSSFNSVDFEKISFTNENLFWSSFGKALKTELQNLFTSPDEIDLIPPIQNQEEFNYAFAKCGQFWQYLVNRQKEMKQPIYERPVIIFIDEFDRMLPSTHTDICNSCLANFRAIKISATYVIKSIVGIGTFSILNLNPTDRTLSPFNISDSFSNPNFTEDQTTNLYKEFMKDYELEIEEQVIEDIHKQTDGYVIGQNLVYLFQIFHFFK